MEIIYYGKYILNVIQKTKDAKIICGNWKSLKYHKHEEKLQGTKLYSCK